MTDKLIKQWRKEANAYMESIRRVQYVDQPQRVRMFLIAQTLRRCANALYQARRKQEQVNGRD